MSGRGGPRILERYGDNPSAYIVHDGSAILGHWTAVELVEVGFGGVFRWMAGVPW